MTQKPAPTLASLEQAMEQVGTLVTAVEALTKEVAKTTRFRRWSTVLAIVMTLLALGGFALLVNEQNKAACEAVNQTNGVVLDLLTQAQASTPKDPPAGSTPKEVAEFRAQQARSTAFYEGARAQLGSKSC